jgi:hypothetical protein
MIKLLLWSLLLVLCGPGGLPHWPQVQLFLDNLSATIQGITLGAQLWGITT